MLSIWNSPIFCPIYADNDHVFLAIFGALANHFKENIQHENLIDMRVPAIHLEGIETVLKGIADVETVSFSTLKPLPADGTVLIRVFSSLDHIATRPLTFYIFPCHITFRNSKLHTHITLAEKHRYLIHGPSISSLPTTATRWKGCRWYLRVLLEKKLIAFWVLNMQISPVPMNGS